MVVAEELKGGQACSTKKEPRPNNYGRGANNSTPGNNMSG
jgi:hypothetical protein